jgi:RNA-directed DNA polymerase
MRGGKMLYPSLEKITNFRNLYLAFRKAKRAKRDNPVVQKFFYSLERELFGIQEDLLEGKYQPGSYHVFWVLEPKRRKICAAPFRDRVVHHALINILEPVFETSMSQNSFACRKKKGIHKALKLARQLAGKYRYFLKCDIEKFFDSVDHGILKEILHGEISDKRILSIFETIIDQPVPGTISGKGIPIGNLTSQHFANLILNKLDHFLEGQLEVNAYLRYMDDFLLFSNSKAELWDVLLEIRQFLGQSLSLRLHEDITRLEPVIQGVPFLGSVVFPNLIRLQAKSRTRFLRNLRRKESDFLEGRCTMAELSRTAHALLGHVSHSKTLMFRKDVLSRDSNLCADG